MGKVLDLRDKTSAAVTYNFDDIDVSSIDPSTIDLGIEAQDCAIIAQTFERAAHSTPSEAAVFATIYRPLTNTGVFSAAAISSLNGFIRQPEEAADEAVRQATNLASSAGVEPNPTEIDAGTQAQIDNIMQSLNLDDAQIPTHGDSFGKNMMDWARDCIPCGLRLASFLELNPSAALLGALEADLNNRLANLLNIGGLLKHSFDGDLCSLLDLLSFTCVPDLQRIIVALMALMLLELPTLDGLIGVLQALIAPIFSPILVSINAILDQFLTLITNPLECVIDAFSKQVRKLEVDMSVSIGGTTHRVQASSPAQDMMADAQAEIARAKAEMNATVKEGLHSGISDLTEMLEGVKKKIEELFDFYVGELRALLGELSFGDTSYLRASLKKLKIIRMVSFVRAVIQALTQEHAACSGGSGKTPEASEIDNFFNNYLNPNSPFDMWVDDDGNIQIDEKTEGMDPALLSLLSKDGNVFQFEGEGPLNPELARAITETTEALTEAAHVSMPCRLETQVSDANKVNEWIQELNKM